MACTFNLTGIQRIYYSTNTLDCSISGNTVLVPTGTTFNRLNVDDSQSAFSESYLTDRNGNYYVNKLDLIHIDHCSSEFDQIKNNSLTVVLKDENGNLFISGYDQQLSFDKQEGTVNKDKNEIAVSLSCTTGQKARPVSTTNLTLIG